MADTIKVVIRNHTAEILSIPGVSGIGESMHRDRPCIIIFVEKKSPELIDRLPDTLEGYTVRIEESGRLRAL